MLRWSSRFTLSCFLASNGYADPHGRFDVLLGAGAVARVTSGPAGGWKTLRRFRELHPDWIMGHVSFEMKQDQYRSGESLTDQIGFPALHFFQPETVLILRGKVVEIGVIGDAAAGHRHAKAVLEEICRTADVPGSVPPRMTLPAAPAWEHRPGREAYLDAVAAIQAHLRRGDAYEVNFCTEHLLRGATPDPVRLYAGLRALSPAPFSALYRVGAHFLASASPERFLQKTGTTLITQPMKGTIRRGMTGAEDAVLVERLRHSAKERSENVMAVDLVRNDLSRTAVPGSVEVTELCGVYTYPQVHQLVSTVRATIRPGVSPEQVLEAAFPMGSMTGAPKHRVLEMIDRYEGAGRGIYSGALGYVTPEEDFDFNVVIRSVACDVAKNITSVQTGSGITVYSDPEAEWEECQLKAYALKQAVAESLS